MRPDLLDECILYRHYDQDGTLLYVGITSNVKRRMEGHRRSATWIERIDHIETEVFPTRRDALAAERQAINSEGPLFNKKIGRRLGIGSPSADAEQSRVITFSVTRPQQEFLVAGMRRYGIGLSEYVRRILDEIIGRSLLSD